jgi:hypothetical protein
MLTQAVSDLKQSICAMDMKSTVDLTSSSSPKFEICAMNAGSIADFHEGLVGRIGILCFQFETSLGFEHHFHRHRFAECRVSEGHGS